ncbi:MAG: helix-turn-helix transcriptional regulator, partial [Bacteroidota bacterium]
VLHRMEHQGLVTSTWRRADTGRRRKYYRLTPKGAEVLEAEKRQWLRVDAVLAQLWGLQPRLT